MIETDTHGWDHLPNGDLEVSLVDNWAVAAAPGLVALRLEIEMENARIGVAQLVLHPAQAAELGQYLQWMADRQRADGPEGQA